MSTITNKVAAYSLKEVFDRGKHDHRLRIDNAKFDSKSVLPINHDGDIVGFYRPTVSLNGSPRVGAIYVLPEYRRMGIAKSVVKNFYREHPDMTYITTDSNVASQALAKSIGLEHRGSAKGNKGSMVFEKSAVDISALPNIYKSFKVYKHPFTRAARRLGMGRLLPFRGGVTSGLKGPVYGKSQGIHIMQRPSTLLSERLKGYVELPELSKDGKRAIDAIVTAHEGLELRSGRKILGNLTNTPAPYDMSRLQTLSYMIRNNINKSKNAVGSVLNSNKYNRVTDILDANRFSSHVSPEVLLQEGNIIATLKGKGATEASDYMRKLRAFTGESSQINVAAKNTGIPDYEWGVTRISRHKRKAIAKALLANPLPTT